MQITDIRVRIVRNDEKLKGVASITIDDCFVIHDLKVIAGPEKPFIAMPSRKTKDGEYKDIAHPINSDTRDQISKMVLDAYNQAVLADQENPQE